MLGSLRNSYIILTIKGDVGDPDGSLYEDPVLIER